VTLSALRPLHCDQNPIVSVRASSAGTALGVGSWLRRQVNTNGTRSSARTVKSETVLKSRPWDSTGLRNQTASGPATAWTWSAWWRTQGVTWP